MRQGRGLTLVEMLVAITLLAIIGAAIVAFLPTIVTLNRSSTEDQETTVVAKKFFEDARSGFENTTADTFADVALPAVPEGCTAANENFNDSEGEVYIRRVSLTCDTDVFTADFGRP